MRTWGAVGGVLTAIVTAVCATGASAAPTITEYAAAPAGANFPVDPLEITTGPDGNIWYTDSGGQAVYRMIASGPSAGQVTEFENSETIGATDLIAEDGAVWFTTGSTIGCITTGGQVTDFPFPSTASTPNTDGITVGPDGNLWFTDVGNNAIGKAAPSTSAPCTLSGAITEYTLPSSVSLATTAGGNTATDANSIASWAGADVVFTEPGSHTIGEFDTSSDTYLATFPGHGHSPLTGSGAPLGIAKGPVGNNGSTWFTEGDEVGRLDPAVGFIQEFRLPNAPSGPFGALWGIAQGRDGNMWFTYGAGAPNAGVGCITSSGSAAQYPAPTQHTNPAGITVGPDGAIWFTEDSMGRIGRLAPATCAAAGTIPTPPRPSRCSRLRLSSMRVLGTLGHREWDLALRSAASVTCTLRGYPSVRLLNRRGRVLAIRAKHARGFPVRTVRLSPRQRAFFTVSYAASGPCLPHFLSAYGLSVTPPGSNRALRLKHPRFDVCSPSIGGRPTVTPVRAKLGGV